MFHIQNEKIGVNGEQLEYVRGRPFDPEGGLANLVRTNYLFSPRSRPENLFPGKQRTEYLFSPATIFLKAKKKGGGVEEVGGGLVRGFSRGAGHSLMFCITFGRLLTHIIAYLVAGMF